MAMASTSKSASASTGSSDRDWSKCALCQTDSKETLVCPTDVSYKTIATNISKFQELNKLPLPIDVNELDSGIGIECTFKQPKVA